MPEYCEAKKFLGETTYLRQTVHVCPLGEKMECPYNNSELVSWEGDKSRICKTRGVIEKSGLLKHLGEGKFDLISSRKDDTQ
ncbi:Uncharacterised protein [uncultured archaeon]|nr:Uncharacterised protein [uncultured archaeon]